MAELNISIKLVDVEKYLLENRALNGISIEFSPGMLHGIVGADGAGKTTLLRTLIGLLRPDSGQIIFRQNGKAIEFPEIRDCLAYLPQQQSLYPDLSCIEHLDFFRDLYKLPQNIYLRKRDELLHIMRLEKFKNRKAGELSGGMYKKLGVMCALLQSPEVLLLDEPTNGVDPISRRELWDLFYRLASENILILISTSYMDEAERCARVHVLEYGKCLFSGEPRAILKQQKAAKFEDIFISRALYQKQN